MKRTRSAIALILGLLVSLTPAADIETLVLKVLENNGRTVSLDFITPENRDGVIELLREIASGKRRQFGTILADDLAAKLILLRLADNETIEKAVAAYERSGSGRGEYYSAEEFVWSEQAAIIPYLASDFFPGRRR